MRPDATDVLSLERYWVFPRTTAHTIPDATNFSSIRSEPFVHRAVLQKDIDPIEVAMHHAALAVFEFWGDRDHASK